jgi:outer membrane protein
MKKTLLLLTLCLGLISLASAAEIKLGFVNIDRIIQDSNELEEITRLYRLDMQNWKNQLNDLDDQIKQMERNFEIDKLTKTEAAKKDAQAQIDAKKAEAGRLLQEYFGEGGRSEQRYLELLEPVNTKINAIIKKIAEDEDYTMIFDDSMGTILYADPSIDLTDMVLLELNKDTVKPTEDGLTNETKPEDQLKPEDNFKPQENKDDFPKP